MIGVQNSKICILYTLICALSPILVEYSFTYSSFTVLDTLIVLFYIISLPRLLMSGGPKVNVFFLWLFLFVVFHASVDYLTNSDTKILLRAMHLANYIFFLAFYNRLFFNSELAIRIVRVVAIFSTIFLLFQHLAYAVVGIPIPGQLPIFLVNDEYALGGVVEMDLIRFSSIFLEPSQYGMYLLCALVLELFYRKRPNNLVILLFCLGAVVSTSNTALAGMVLLLMLYVRKIGISVKMIALAIVALFVIFVLAGTFVDAILIRVGDGSSFGNRFNGYSQIKDLLSANPIWGIGFWSTEDMGDDYLPGWARLYVYFGIIGVLFYAVVYLLLYRSISNKIIFFLALFFNFGGDSFFSVYLLFYSCFFLLKKDCIKKKTYRDSITLNTDASSVL